jgi:hypothetical protein
VTFSIDFGSVLIGFGLALFIGALINASQKGSGK